MRDTNRKVETQTWIKLIGHQPLLEYFSFFFQFFLFSYTSYFCNGLPYTSRILMGPPLSKKCGEIYKLCFNNGVEHLDYGLHTKHSFFGVLTKPVKKKDWN
jgi:hypothetical protein